MAIIKREVLQAPLDVRLEEAACVYWGVDTEFFRVKEKDGNTEKRWILFFLLVDEAGSGVITIAERFGYSHSTISEGIATVRCRKGLGRRIADDCNNILKIAATLDYKVMTADVKLE